MSQQKRDRLGIIHPPLMVGVAAVFDLMQAFVSIFHFLPVVGNLLAIAGGWIITVMAFLTFSLWFLLLGISLLTPNPLKGLLYGGAAVVEMTPFISALPALTGAVVAIILIVKREDAVYNKKMKRRQARAV